MRAAGIVVANHERADIPAFQQQLDKLLRRKRRELARKRNASNLLRTQRTQNGVALRNAGKQPYAAAEHLHGVIGKRKHNGLCAEPVRFGNGLPDQCAMSEMYAVEHAKCDDGGDAFLHVNLW